MRARGLKWRAEWGAASEQGGTATSRKHRNRSVASIPAVAMEKESEAAAACARLGLLKASASHAPGVFEHIPVALSPCPLPRAAYSTGRSVAPRVTSLLHQVASDKSLLRSLLGSAATSDAFTDNLWWVMEQAEHSHSSAIDLGIHRVDFMLDHASSQLLMVEANTISASFAGIGPLVPQLQREFFSFSNSSLPGELPRNPAAEGVAEALSDAWRAYGNGAARVLFVVQPTERNLLDQHALSWRLFMLHGVNSERYTLTQIAEHASLDNDGQLFIDGSLFSVVYFRAGYSPEDYPSEREWKARRLLEVSRAVKCPSAAVQLAGAKKVQQQLAQADVLERLDPKGAEDMRHCFAGQYSFDGDDSEETRRMGLQNPNQYVLKPQREGGGNNLYGEELRQTLKDVSSASELKQYVLMDRIQPASRECPMLRQGKLEMREAVAEVGMFTVHMAKSGETQRSACIGNLVRSKDARADEGGVVAGNGVLDSAVLIETASAESL